MTRMAHSAGNWIVFDAGSRDRRAEYKAMEDWVLSEHDIQMR